MWIRGVTLLFLGGVDKHSGTDLHTQVATHDMMQMTGDMSYPELGMRGGGVRIYMSLVHISGWGLGGTRNVER